MLSRIIGLWQWHIALVIVDYILHWHLFLVYVPISEFVFVERVFSSMVSVSSLVFRPEWAVIEQGSPPKLGTEPLSPLWSLIQQVISVQVGAGILVTLVEHGVSTWIWGCFGKYDLWLGKRCLPKENHSRRGSQVGSLLGHL